MSIRQLLEALENGVLLEQKETYKKEELTPVIINPPKGKAKPLPSQKGGEQIKVEVINTGKPQPGEKDGEGEEGAEGAPQKETKKTQKPGEGKPSKKPTTIDSHDILKKSDAGEAKEMAEKILEKAEATRKERGEGEEGAGIGEGNYMEKLRDIYKPKINWVKELKKKLTEFRSQTSTAINRYSRKTAQRYKEGEGVQKSKAYHQWLKDPRSHAPDSKILFKGPYVKAPIGEVVLIVALDVSGSIPATTISKVFGEMDKIARGFKSGISHSGVSLEGKVYFMAWDTVVKQVDEYKLGDWKKYITGEKMIKGRGGTDPTSIFKHMREHFLFDEDKPSAGLLNILQKPKAIGMTKDDIVIPVKDGESDPKAVISPFMIIATDGEFFENVKDSDLGILYKDNKENVLYLVIDGITERCYPKNIIEYESYRV